MLHSFFKLLHQSLYALVILFALQAVAQPAITYHSKVEESEKYKNGNEYQKDFLIFMDMLQTTHPAFVKNPPFDVEKEQEQGYSYCGKCKDLQEFTFYIQQRFMMSILELIFQLIKVCCILSIFILMRKGIIWMSFRKEMKHH